MKRLLCWLFRHDWRHDWWPLGYDKGARPMRYWCQRCKARKEEP